MAKGVQPSTSSDYKPVVAQSVTYVVMGVLINERGEVLMMQEAKKSCAGQWYLPAGRMEPGETIEEAVAREVLEETGLHMQPTTLLAVETASGSWYRFVLTGRVTGMDANIHLNQLCIKELIIKMLIGGELKVPAQADSESLQAKWVKKVQELSLRSQDILEVIDKARAFHGRTKADPWHPNLLPSPQAHTRLLLQLVVCIKQRASNRIHVLLSEKNQVHLPLCEIYPSRSVHATLRKFMVVSMFCL